MGGWIKLHRSILDNPITCKDAHYFSVWCYLLLNATHKEREVIFKKDKVTLKAGQLITGRKVIAKHFNIDESKVQRILKTLENEQQIEQQTSNQNRLITIVNWSLYQQSEQQIEQQVNNGCTTDEHKQERKKEKKKEINTSAEEVWSKYPKKSGKQRAIIYINNLLKENTKEELINAVNKYIKFIEMERIKFDRNYQDGATFFNKGIYDFLVKGEVIEFEERKVHFGF